jgi:hypothetical protein
MTLKNLLDLTNGILLNTPSIKKADEMGYFILQRKGDMVVTHSEHLRVA